MNTNSDHDSSGVPSVPITRPGQIREALLAGVISTGLVMKVIREGLQATTRVVHNGKLTEVPDLPMRMKYVQFLTETVEGLPVKRQEIITKRLTSEKELKRMIACSPAFRKTLKELLIELESEALTEDAS